jgi:hypothetical protein
VEATNRNLKTPLRSCASEFFMEGKETMRLLLLPSIRRHALSSAGNYEDRRKYRSSGARFLISDAGCGSSPTFAAPHWS